MSDPSSFKTLHASVRPPRVAVLVDKSDEYWHHTCLRVIEFFSKLWGGAYNLIVPTDGKTIDERFWRILEAFDPDHLYVYRKCGEDFRLSTPDEYAKRIEADLQSYQSQFGSQNAGTSRDRIDKDLRNSWMSSLAITPQLQNEIKVRLSPFYFEEWIVETGAISARAAVGFPLTSLANIILNTRHPDRFAEINAPSDLVPKLWYSAVLGLADDSAAEKLEGLGILRNRFDFEKNNISQLMELVITGAIEKPWALRANQRIFSELDGIAPYQLSMIELGLYRSTKYAYWNEPLILVAGAEFEDFCLYYCLSRIRDRVVWILPSITQGALSANKTEISEVEMSFMAQVRGEDFSQQSHGGLACMSYTLSDAEIEAVIGRFHASPHSRFRSPIAIARSVADLVRMPLVAVERDNLQRDISVQFANDVSISPFTTPKPKNFHTIHPYEHRYITQLSVAQEAPPKHFHLGNWIISDRRLTTKEVRVGRDGPAYFCPNIAYFGGDIDTVLVRPYLRLPPLHKVIAELARTQGYECRPSDKGIYADETIAKWGGLDEAAGFLRDGAKRSLLEQFLDKSPSEAGKGVYLTDDRRRYLDLPAAKALVGACAASLIDELVSKQILYRGFIFICSYCRNSSWFSVNEIAQDFKCRRCSRNQLYTRANWKMPEEPAWFYKLDELVYQGYRQGMAVSLLALDYLKKRSSENFSFTTDREFWKPNASKPVAEVDLFCVSDGVLIIGEAKEDNRLGKSVSDENGEIAKYKQLASGLGVRQLVLATSSNGWNTQTKERVIAALSDMPYVAIKFLAVQELLS